MYNRLPNVIIPEGMTFFTALESMYIEFYIAL